MKEIICELCNDLGCDDCLLVREAISDYKNRVRIWKQTGEWIPERMKISW